MDDLSFELNGLAFGGKTDLRIVPGGFDHGYPTLRTQDSDNPVGSGRFMGREIFGGMKWGFTGFVNQDDLTSGLASLRTLAGQWVRERDPNDYDVLRYQLDSDVRRVYGRSRRFSDTLDNRLLVGNVPWVAEFEVIDSNTYEDFERSTFVAINPPAAGGFITPFTVPLTTVASGVQQGSINSVGGDAPAPFILEIHGSLTAGAAVTGKNWRIELQESLLNGETLTVDTTPWGLGIYRGSDPVSGMLSPRTSRLFDARLDPAGDFISIEGVSPSGNASATVRWRAASTSI